jgi:ribosomal protein L32E
MATSTLSWQQQHSSLGQPQSLVEVKKTNQIKSLRFDKNMRIQIVKLQDHQRQKEGTFSEVALETARHVSHVPHPSRTSGLAPDGLHTPII